MAIEQPGFLAGYCGFEKLRLGMRNNFAVESAPFIPAAKEGRARLSLWLRVGSRHTPPFGLESLRGAKGTGHNREQSAYGHVLIPLVALICRC